MQHCWRLGSFWLLLRMVAISLGLLLLLPTKACWLLLGLLPLGSSAKSHRLNRSSRSWGSKRIGAQCWASAKAKGCYSLLGAKQDASSRCW